MVAKPALSRARIALLQFRHPQDPVLAHELACFARGLGVPKTHLTCFNLVSHTPSLESLLPFDLLLAGGSGSYCISQNNMPRIEPALALLASLVAHRRALFGACFGYQCLVTALGGTVIGDPVHTEVGTFWIDLTEEGQQDPLFKGLPSRFEVQQGHRDRAQRHPKDIPNLARSERAPLQALAVAGAPVWATQFHPELCAQDNLARFARYAEGYAQKGQGEGDRPSGIPPNTEPQTCEKWFRKTPIAEGLLLRFAVLGLGLSVD